MSDELTTEHEVDIKITAAFSRDIIVRIRFLNETIRDKEFRAMKLATISGDTIRLDKFMPNTSKT